MSTSHRVTFAALLLAGVLCAATLFVGRADPDAVTPGPDASFDVTRDRSATTSLAAVAERPDESPRDALVPQSSTRAPIVVEPRAKRRPAPEPRAAMVAPMNVRVVDERDAAVVGARVDADLECDDGSRIRARSAVTDALGVATIDAGRGVRTKLSVVPAADDFAHAEGKFELGVALALAVRLESRRWLELAVVDGDRQPVAELEWVEIERDGRRATARERRNDGPRGTHFIEVGNEPGIAHLRSTRAGIGEHAFDPADSATMRGLVRLVRPSVIEAITTRDGSAVAGVRVGLVVREDPECLSIGRLVLGSILPVPERYFGEQTSDASGRVSFAIDEFREYVLVAEAQGVGACEQRVVVDRAGRRVDVKLVLSRGSTVELRTVGSGSARVPVSVFGPAGTRRSRIVDGGTPFVADGLPPGRYVASVGGRVPDSGRHFELDGIARSELALSLAPRCRLEVEGPQRGIELYAATCPARRVRDSEQPFGGPTVFETDDPGRHVLVCRAGGPTPIVHVLQLELVLGTQSVQLGTLIRQPKEIDSGTVEVVTSKAFGPRDHRWRGSPRDGVQSYYSLRHQPLLDPASGKRVSGAGWSTVVPAGVIELVRVDQDGSIEVVIESVRVVPGETRRFELQDER